MVLSIYQRVVSNKMENVGVMLLGKLKYRERKFKYFYGYNRELFQVIELESYRCFYLEVFVQEIKMDNFLY